MTGELALDAQLDGQGKAHFTLGTQDADQI